MKIKKEIEELKEKLDSIILRTELINHQQKLIYNLQKRDNSFFFSIGLFFTAIFSFIVSPSWMFKGVAIILLIISLIIYFYVKRKRDNEKIDYINGLIIEYRKRGFNDKYIKEEIPKKLFI